MSSHHTNQLIVPFLHDLIKFLSCISIAFNELQSCIKKIISQVPDSDGASFADVPPGGKTTAAIPSDKTVGCPLSSKTSNLPAKEQKPIDEDLAHPFPAATLEAIDRLEEENRELRDENRELKEANKVLGADTEKHTLLLPNLINKDIFKITVETTNPERVKQMLSSYEGSPAFDPHTPYEAVSTAKPSEAPVPQESSIEAQNEIPEEAPAGGLLILAQPEDGNETDALTAAGNEGIQTVSRQSPIKPPLDLLTPTEPSEKKGPTWIENNKIFMRYFKPLMASEAKGKSKPRKFPELVKIANKLLSADKHTAVKIQSARRHVKYQYLPWYEAKMRWQNENR